MGCGQSTPKQLTVDSRGIQHLSDQYVEQFFNTADAKGNSNGKIDIAEASGALTQIGINIEKSKELIQECWELLDKEQSKQATLAEFKVFMYALINSEKGNKARTIFFLCDKNQSGTISVEEFKKVAIKLNKDLTEEQIIEAMHEKEEIGVEKFIKVVTKRI
ncbi:Calmodulin [Hexamita inflata]|uniref:Calmodulin n=1 Tax=Hexamita inflata TaxID=28002 RepID=A0AA86UT73_9EUKA|nr:Calmodulin [Hexamita inflata]CAI9932572.1 Calmodulin [Hexamita inflata]CAI9967059.1 Calmodulin [Hexamita inflata]